MQNFEIVKDVIDFINLDRFREFNRRHGLKVSGLKRDLVSFIEDSVKEGKIDKKEVENFIAEEISYGKNRILFISSFPMNSVNQLRNIDFVRDSLKASRMKCEDFNELHSTAGPDDTTLAYLKISKSEEGDVKKIQLCFAQSFIYEGLMDDEGEELPPRRETDYSWVDIIPEDQKIIIKMRQRSSNYFVNEGHYRNLYDDISTTIREIFALAPKSMEGNKNTLYRIFKDLTETAEKPFTEKVNPYHLQIAEFTEDITSKVGLKSAYDPVDLPHRVIRLLERSLIQQDFDQYEGYFEGKSGIVNRIYFSDATGATVNARSSEVEEGIAVADIYFDTKESIEKSQKFDKLWVTWFLVDDEEKPPLRIETKFEVFKEHYVIHFLYAYTTKEMQEHVLSNFKHYEEIPGR